MANSTNLPFTLVILTVLIIIAKEIAFSPVPPTYAGAALFWVTRIFVNGGQVLWALILRRREMLAGLHDCNDPAIALPNPASASCSSSPSSAAHRTRTLTRLPFQDGSSSFRVALVSLGTAVGCASLKPGNTWRTILPGLLLAQLTVLLAVTLPTPPSQEIAIAAANAVNARAPDDAVAVTTRKGKITLA